MGSKMKPVGFANAVANGGPCAAKRGAVLWRGFAGPCQLKRCAAFAQDAGAWAGHTRSSSGVTRTRIRRRIAEAERAVARMRAEANVRCCIAAHGFKCVCSCIWMRDAPKRTGAAKAVKAAMVVGALCGCGIEAWR